MKYSNLSFEFNLRIEFNMGCVDTCFQCPPITQQKITYGNNMGEIFLTQQNSRKLGCIEMFKFLVYIQSCAVYRIVKIENYKFVFQAFKKIDETLLYRILS